MSAPESVSTSINVWDRRARIAWAIAAAWAVVIWILGSDLFSAQEPGGRLLRLLTWLFGELPQSVVDLYHLAVRKGAHLFEYGLLAVLVLRAGRLAPALPLRSASGLAIAVVFALASSDELRQAGIASRTGSAWDVAIDCTGAVAALTTLAIARRTRLAPLARIFLTPRAASSVDGRI